MRIGIDLMGSDSSPKVLFEAVRQVAEQHDASHTLVVIATPQVADEVYIANIASLASPNTARIEFHLVNEFITMGDEPLSAVRHKKGSSLVVGMRMLKKHLIDAFITAGNTGALVASATISLPMLPGINRPALLAILPTEKGSVAVIDVGGNVYCKAHHLIQFAQLGAVYQCCIRGIERPTVGLLNIGVESKKGTSELRQAYESLQTLHEQSTASPALSCMQFAGNVEGRDVFQGKIDVLVTDGFTGNVLLKTTEGVSSFIFEYLDRTFLENTSQGMKRSLQNLQRHFNYAEYPGAIVCGIDGLVVKCHGNSSSRAMYNGILGAINLVNKKLVNQLKGYLASSSNKAASILAAPSSKVSFSQPP